MLRKPDIIEFVEEKVLRYDCNNVCYKETCYEKV